MPKFKFTAHAERRDLSANSESLLSVLDLHLHHLHVVVGKRAESRTGRPRVRGRLTRSSRGFAHHLLPVLDAGYRTALDLDITMIVPLAQDGTGVLRFLVVLIVLLLESYRGEQD